MGRALQPQSPPSAVVPASGEMYPPAAGGPPHFPGMEPEEGVPWHRYLAAVLRFKWLILGVLGLGAAAGVTLARTVSPEYETSAMIWVNTRADHSGPIRTGALLESSSWVELLRSFAVADEASKSLRLYISVEEPADRALFTTFERTDSTRNGAYLLQVDSVGATWTLSTAKEVLLERGAVGDSIGRRLGMRWLPPRQALAAGREVPFTVVPVRHASARVLSRLLAILPEEGSFMRVSLRGSEPELTAQTLNALTEAYVDAATSLQRRKATELKLLIESQLILAEHELRESEIGLESFRANTITLPTENLILAPTEQTRDPALNAFFLQRTQYEGLRHDRELLERVVRNARNGIISPEALLSIPGIMSEAPHIQATIAELTEKEAQLRAARQTLTEEHPTVRQLAAGVTTLREITIPQHARATLAQMRERETVLSERVAGASRELRQIPPRTIEEGRLRRRVAVSEQLYNMLRTRYEEAKLAELGAAPDVKILDAAVAPSFPSSNAAPRLVLLALIASLGVAVGLALLLDRLDRRFRYVEQATNDLGLSIVGAVPRIARSRRGDVNMDIAARTVEAFRSIRLTVRYAVGQRGPLQLAVSSPGKGDGKSFVSSNLALAFAQAGFRTLLVDGDMRRGELHRTFDLERTPGFADYLNDGLDFDAVVMASGHEGLWVVPSGTRRARSPELLSAACMDAFWTRARERFDVIIVDTPPLIAGIDAYALAAQAGNLLIVLRHGMTNRKMAAAKLATVDRLPISVVGAVLNEAPDEGDYTYYGYDSVPEDESVRWTALPPATAGR